MTNQDPDILLQDLPVLQPRLQVAVVTETWPPEVNGVALTLSRLVQTLCERGHRVQLVRPRQMRADAASQAEGIEEKLMRGMPIPRYPQLKLGLPARRALVRSWTYRRPDLVHIATEGPLGWSALQAARQLRLPVSSDFRTNFHSYSSHYGLGWLKKPIAAYLRRFHNQADLTMVPTRALAADLINLGFERVRVVGRGIDTQLFHPARRHESLRQRWGADPDATVLLAVGRLAAEKNLDLVVRTYEAMRARNPRTRLVLAGDGPMRFALAQRCPDAVFMGQCSHEDLAGCYASADLLLFPSLTETFGNVTLEAMASGLAVLAFDVAAAAQWVVHGDSGWLVRAGDSDAYLDQAVALASDPIALRNAGARASKQVSGNDWQQVASQVEGLWTELMDPRRIPCSVQPLPAF
ncbi:MAG: glycosyltransferase family 1 protein [Burkholderiales bacterium]|nr:MAG: glycosyltransferase family 1 protein [Burkholderiales bacterium]